MWFKAPPPKRWSMKSTFGFFPLPHSGQREVQNVCFLLLFVCFSRAFLVLFLCFSCSFLVLSCAFLVLFSWCYYVVLVFFLCFVLLLLSCVVCYLVVCRLYVYVRVLVLMLLLGGASKVPFQVHRWVHLVSRPRTVFEIFWKNWNERWTNIIRVTFLLRGCALATSLAALPAASPATGEE